MTFACFALHTVGINVDTRAQVRLTSTVETNVDGPDESELYGLLVIATSGHCNHNMSCRIIQVAG